MKTKIERFFPVGYKFKTEKNIIILAYIIPVFIFLMEFGSCYYSGYLSLLSYGDGPKTIRPDATMPYYYTMVDNTLKLFAPTILLFLFLIVLHYKYHMEGSKSIYLMKRLPNKNEIHIRCLTVSLAGIATVFLTVFMLIAATYYFYISFTPPQCLPKDILGGLIDNIIYLIISEVK